MNRFVYFSYVIVNTLIAIQCFEVFFEFLLFQAVYPSVKLTMRQRVWTLLNFLNWICKKAAPSHILQYRRPMPAPALHCDSLHVLTHLNNIYKNVFLHPEMQWSTYQLCKRHLSKYHLLKLTGAVPEFRCHPFCPRLQSFFCLIISPFFYPCTAFDSDG